MPWFKVDDSLHTHPKWLAASSPARALWTTAGSWSAHQLTDGFVPAHVLPVLGGRTKDAAELVAVGLWLTEDGGWRFHDWHDQQPTRETVLSNRDAAKERQRRARERARESRRDAGVSHGDVTAVVTVPPTRPDPTHTKPPPVDTHVGVPDEVWKQYARLVRERSRGVSNVAAFDRKVIASGKLEHGSTAEDWWSRYELTPSELAAGLVEGKAGRYWTRRTA